MDKQLFKEHLQLRIPARWHMSLICMVTIAVGIIISKGILYFNLAEPMIRYGVAVLISYGVFFLLIYFWLQIHFGSRQENSMERVPQSLDVIDDIIAVDEHAGSGLRTNLDSNMLGQKGHFSVRDARSSLESHSDESVPLSKESNHSKSLFELAGSDEAVVVVLLIAVIAAIFGSAGYLIYQAPEILFEAAFEAILATSLVRQAKKMQSEGWHSSIFKRTWWMCAIILFLAMSFGYVIKKQCPEAMSFADYRSFCAK